MDFFRPLAQVLLRGLDLCTRLFHGDPHRGGNSLYHAAPQELQPRLLFTTTLYWFPVSNDHWDTTTANWNTAYDDSGTQEAWTNGDDAVFMGNDSDITISGTVQAHSVQFTGDSSYTVSGGTLTLGGGVNYFNADTAISSAIAGSYGFNIIATYPTAVTLTGANTYTGGTLINGGIVTVSGSALTALTANNLTIEGGAHTLTLDGGSIINGIFGEDYGAAANWNSGTLAATGGGSITNYDKDDDTFTVGSGDTATLGEGTSFIGTLTNNGTLTIGGNTTFTDGTLLNDGGTITMDAGSGTLTLNNSTLVNGNSDIRATPGMWPKAHLH